MAELLLELLSEEIPSRMQAPMAEQLKESMAKVLDKENLFNTGIETFVTPRRLVLSVGGLSLTQEETTIEKRGPRTDAPQEAIDGFLRSTGLTIEALTKRQTDKGEFYFAIHKQQGKPTKEVLKDALDDIIPSITWPKSMRWGSHDIRWVRPLHNILCVFGGEVLPTSFGHLTANNNSEGHRFLAPEPFEAEDLESLKSQLAMNHVILDLEERKKVIKNAAQALASEKKLTLLADEELLNEVAGLVEWPEVCIGNIDENYMHVPEEVLISSIRTHQKYFCLRDKSGSLAPYFIVVSNMKTEDQGANIVAGNERVLRARLSDANFFWNQDRKKALDEHVDKLEHIIFHAKLGTLEEKTKRIQAIAKFLAVWVPHASLESVERASLLSKSDLSTEMVGEFPELQGTMGYYYAKEAGENDEVSLAIKEHYAPLGPSDDCPTDPVSVAVAIADKIDSLAGLFTIDEKPTGSKDPFALRRAAIGVIRLILENKLSVPLKMLFEHSLKQYPKKFFKQPEDKDEEEEGKKKKLRVKRAKKVKPAVVVEELLAFFGERLKALLKAENVRHDLISAVFDSGEEDDILRAVQRVAALDRFLATEDGTNLLAAYRRATNIVSIEEKKDNTTHDGNPNKKLLQQDEEIVLFDLLQSMKPKIKKLLKQNKFEEAMETLSHLRQPIDAFFDKVTVNCDQTDQRKNRLKILAQLRELLHDIADFSLIEG